MMNYSFLQSSALIITVCTLLSCATDDQGVVDVSKPEKILEVTEVTLDVMESEPPQLSIVAIGKARSAGWTDPQLIPHIYVMPPQDGIYDFDFVATRQTGVSPAVVTSINVDYILKPLPRSLKGVRIHAEVNNKVAMLDSSVVNEAYFEFKDSSKTDRFVIKLIDAQKIQQARDMLSGMTDHKSIMGTIVKEKASYNQNWSYHLEPESIRFFETAIEVCDANMRYVEKHLDEVGGSFLPNNQWCPWSSELTQELPAPVSDN